MTSLSDRVEAATGADRELDAEIFWLVDNGRAQRLYWSASLGKPKKLTGPLPGGLGRIAVRAEAPRYTASLDAAMTLVPEGCSVLLATSPVGAVCDVHSKPLGENSDWLGHSRANSPSLALTAASLRARGL